LREAIVNDQSNSDFEKIAAESWDGTFLGEFWQFLRHNKKWWLIPLLLVLLLVSVLLLLSGSAAAPFIYTLF
jgi:Family of unknown function (DUF5989)